MNRMNYLFNKWLKYIVINYVFDYLSYFHLRTNSIKNIAHDRMHIKRNNFSQKMRYTLISIIYARMLNKYMYVYYFNNNSVALQIWWIILRELNAIIPQ